MKVSARAVGLALVVAVWLAGCDRQSDETPPVTAEQVRQALHLPRYRGDLSPQVVRQSRRRDLFLEWVEFAGRRGQTIPALVCYPEAARVRPRPAVLCMPGTPNRKEDLIQPLDLLWRLADEGFFALAIDRPYHGQRRGDPDQAIREKGLGRVWGEYVYDLSRALDYLGTRPEAAPGHTAFLGLSMGGMEALLLGAVDDRIRAAVSVAGQVSWEPVFASGAWRRLFGGLPLTAELEAAGASDSAAYSTFRRRLPELAVLDASRLAPLMAPRPLLLITGANDPLIGPEAARHTYESALAAYEDGGAPQALSLWIEAGAGHGFTHAMEDRAVAWLKAWE